MSEVKIENGLISMDEDVEAVETLKEVKFGTSTDELAPFQVYQSYDYSKFYWLKGNRGEISERAKKVIESIKKIGLQPFPIIVNQFFEIIEGQARFTAFKEKGLPIWYIIVIDGDASICRSANQADTSWGEPNYIHSYADTGNENFKRLIRVHEKYGFTYLALYCFAQNHLYCGNVKNKEYKEGTLIFTEEKEKLIDKYAEILTSPIIEKFKSTAGITRIELIQGPLFWLATHTGIDMDILMKEISLLEVRPYNVRHYNSKRQAEIQTYYRYALIEDGHYPVKTAEDILKLLLTIYNYAFDSKKLKVDVEKMNVLCKKSTIRGNAAKKLTLSNFTDKELEKVQKQFAVTL